MESMAKKYRKILINSVVLLLMAFLGKDFLPCAAAQSGLYVPSTKPVRNMQRALTNPSVFYLLLHFDSGQSEYAEVDLDLLDSAYRIAFSVDNPMYYTMTLEGYGTADEQLTRYRVDAVYRYFAMRSHSSFPIRLAKNKIHCSCEGDTVEVLRFEVPVTTAVYNCSELPEARRMLNKSIDMTNCVLVTFRDDPDECVGSARGCYVPQRDSLVHGYYASLLLTKGSVYAVGNTKDTCPQGMEIKIEDHLNYRAIVDEYRMIPHRRQLLVQAGYIVINAKLPVVRDSCTEAQRDSIFIRIPATQEQVEAKLKFFARVKTSRGWEYKSLPTRKVPGKGPLMLQAPLNIMQLDTVYLGRRIQEKEVSKYFYEVESPTEAASFAIGNRFYVASRPGKNGEPVLKKPLRKLFRIIVEQEEDNTPRGERQKKINPDEIIDE